MAEVLGPNLIGSEVWPGLAKTAEETGELLQVIGKLFAFPGCDHPDGGPPLDERLQDEIADVQAILDFVVRSNDLDAEYIEERKRVKIQRFDGWHQGGVRA